MEDIRVFCTDCKLRSCIDCDAGKEEGGLPRYCLTGKFREEAEKAAELYQEEENLRIAQGFYRIDQKGIHGGQATRVEMLLKLFREIGAKRIGVATCYALLNEARTFSKILKANGFECIGVNCKVGTMDKGEIGISAEEDPFPGESSCNPIMQALIMNREKTDYNVIIGLCVGHDALFSKYSEAPVSTLVAKDFALAHNTVAVLHMADGYYSELLNEKRRRRRRSAGFRGNPPSASRPLPSRRGCGRTPSGTPGRRTPPPRPPP
jgi:uncharacterized metal-binding protein